EPPGSPQADGAFDADVPKVPAICQELPEQRVVAIPDATIVQRDQKGSRVLNLLDEQPAVAALERGVAKLRAKAVEHGGPDEEIPEFGAEGLENLLLEKLADAPLIAMDGAGNLAAAGYGSAQAGGPAFRKLHQPVNRVAGGLARSRQHQPSCLSGTEPQLVDPDLAHLAPHAPARKRNVHGSARRQDELQILPRVVDQLS